MAKEFTGSSGWLDVVYTVKNTILCYLFTVVFLFLASVAATYLTMSESAVNIIVGVISAFCVFIGGFRAARHAGKQGLLCGVASGIVYMVLLYAIGCLVMGELSFTTATALSMAIGIGCSALGGIIGVNTKTKKRR